MRKKPRRSAPKPEFRKRFPASHADNCSKMKFLSAAAADFPLPENASLPNVGGVVARHVTEYNPSQLKNANSPIDVIDEGNSISANPSAFIKQLLGIDVRLLGIFIDVKLRQAAKAATPRLVKLLDKLIYCSCVQPWNAPQVYLLLRDLCNRLKHFHQCS